MYVARLGALTLWDVHRKRGGAHIKYVLDQRPSLTLWLTNLLSRYGEVLLFAAAWAQLASLRRHNTHVSGLVGLGLDMVDRA